MFPGIMTKLSESALVASTTITPLTDLVLVSGTTNIATITAPPISGGVSAGIIFIVPTDPAAFAVVTTGNIGLAVTLTTGKAVLFVYSAAQAKWYPGTIS